MSEQGWRDFLAAEGVADWVVLHGGATAVFPVSSLGDAARLAEAVAQVPGIDGAGVLITIADDQVTVRLTRGVETARRSGTSHSREQSRRWRDGMERPRIGLVLRRSRSPSRHIPGAVDVGFWRAVARVRRTGRRQRRRPARPRLDGVDAGSRPDQAPATCDARRRVRRARACRRRRLAAALAAGGRIVDDVGCSCGLDLADRAGNRVCIAAWPDGSVPPSWLTRNSPPSD